MERKHDNPWKGLDSYRESDRLFGRDEEIEVLFSRIEYNIQTVVYSRSGIGKSSLINAGIFPKARKAGMLPVGIRLQHSAKKGVIGTPYIEQVKNAVSEELLRCGGRAEEIVPHREGHEETLWEYLHRFRFYVNAEGGELRVVPLLVFDQFEEIFTLEKNVGRIVDFFAQVADLLNGIKPEYLIVEKETVVGAKSKDSRLNIFKNMKDRVRNAGADYLQEDSFHVVFTLREDYLSYLERYTTHIPSLKMNRYCLLPITEEQAASVIMDPRPGLVSAEVATFIIEKITGETNFKLEGHPEIFVDSAILSLYLSRLYDRLPEGEHEITAELVNKLSEDIIQDFYQEAIKGIPSTVVEYLEDNLLNNEGRRENVSEYNAKHIGGLTDDDIHTLCVGRRLIRRFDYGGDMRLEFIHDILCPVVMERRNTRHLVRLQQDERRKLMEQERSKRRAIMEKAKAEKQRYRRWMVAGSIAFLAIALLWIYEQYMNNWTCSEYYPSYAFVNGWPIGVGEKLSEKEAKKLAVSFKLTKQGHRKSIPFKALEVMSPDGNLLHNNKYTPIVDAEDRDARPFLEMLDNTKYMRFSSTEHGDTAFATKYEALDRKGRVLYVVTYFSPVEDQENDDLTSEVSYVWAVFTDAKGSPLQVRRNGADRMQVFLNEQGQEVKYMFFDGNRAPKQNTLGYYGYKAHYDHLNRLDSMWIVDPFSEEQFKVGILYGDHSVDYRCYDLQNNPINNPALNYHRRLIEMDDRGNIIKKYYFGPDGKYVDDQIRPAIANMEYDKMNRVISTYDYDGNGEPYTQNPKFYPHREYQYIRNTIEKLYERDYRWDARKKQMVEVRRFETELFGSVVEKTTENYEKNEYNMVRLEYDEDEQPVSVSYYGRDDKPMFDSIDNFHKHIIERRRMPSGKTIVVHRYYDTDGSLYSMPGKRDYAIDSCVYSPSNQLLCQVCYNRDTVIVLSQCYEYADGVEVMRYARGVNNTPIRCPKWERDGLSYYKLKSVHSSKNVISYVKPINEYGTSSWAYDGIDPMGMLEQRDQKFTIDPLGSDWRKETLVTVYADHIPTDAQTVVYVDLLKPNSIAHRIGLRDGDLLLKAGNWQYTANPSVPSALREWDMLGHEHKTVKVARYDIGKRKWKILSFEINPFRGKFECEIYPIYYTNEEYSEFKKVLAQ